MQAETSRSTIGALSPTVFGSCGKDPPIAHTHLATVPNAIAERGFKPFVQDRRAPVVSVMPFSLYRRLDLNKLTPTEISLQMDDK